jgi:DNA-directed RNA polymerase specialized sigma24 family protein
MWQRIQAHERLGAADERFKEAWKEAQSAAAARRDAVRGARLAGYSLAEIASVLGVSSERVRLLIEDLRSPRQL